MVNEMSNGKMLYAYLKVMDPNTSLPKSVLVNWVSTAFICMFDFWIVFVYWPFSILSACLLCINF